MKLNWGKTFALGFGFMSISVVASLYDSYMGKFYEEFIASSTIVGLIMAIDNAFGMTLQPWFGALSDRTQSSWGRRRPFLLIGMPIAALGVMAIPFARTSGLLPLLLVTIVLNVALAVFRSPTVALMPDFTPSPLRSLANGVINLMGGLGSALALLGGSILYAMNVSYPFLMAGGVMVTVFLIFLLFIREPARPAEESAAEETPQSLLQALKHVVTNPDRDMLALFLAIFAWFVGYQAVNTWFTLYGEQILGIPVQAASARLTFFAGSFILGAVPAGYLGTKLGRRKTIAIGLSGMVASFLALHFLTALPAVTVVLVVAGLCWPLVNINSYPMVVEQCSAKQTGTYTGVYYIFSGLAGVAGPAVSGAVFDLMGSKRPLFFFAMVCMALALSLILMVRKGEANPAARAQSA